MKALIAEDDLTSRRLMAGMLARWGYEVVSVADGSEAYEALSGREGPRIALLDWSMPGMDGVEVCRRIREERSEEPPYIILVTARGQKGDLVAGLAAGADDYIAKPCDPDELRARLKVGERVAALQSDLAERARAIHDSQRRLAFHVRRTPLAYIEWDPEFVALEWNPAAERIFGYTRKEALGRSGFDLVVPEDEREEWARAWSELLKGVDWALGAARNVTREGRPIYCEWHNTPLLDDDGQVVGVASLAQDVTERRRSHEALRRSDAILRAVAYAAECFLRTGPQGAGMREALARLGEATEVDEVRVFENFRDRQGALRMSRRYSWPPPDAETGRAAAEVVNVGYAESGLSRWEEALGSGETLYGNVRQFPAGEREELERRGLVAIAAAPIFVGEEWWGFASFQQCRQEREWHDVEADALKAAGATLGAAIQRGRQEEALAEARWREVAIASRIQDALLLGRPPRDWPQVNVATLAIPSQAVDGDFFDFFAQKEDRLDVVVGDVMGKGVPAALVGAATKSELLRATALLLLAGDGQRLPAPEEIVGRLHSVMTPKLIALESAVTLCYARFDLRLGRLDFVDCGHTKTVHFRKRTGRCETLWGENIPLGFDEDFSYVQRTTDIEEGDLLFFYSDGLTEARNRAGEMFGPERLVGLVQSRSDLSPRALVAAARDAAVEFSGSRVFADDLTCVAIRIKGAAAERAPVSSRLETTSDFSELRRIQAFVQSFCRQARGERMDEDTIAQIQLAVHEAATNIMEHAYKGRDEGMIWLQADAFGDRMAFQLRDKGGAFNPALIKPPPFDGTEAGGFGLFIIRECFEGVEYTRDADGRNLLILTKRF